MPILSLLPTVAYAGAIVSILLIAMGRTASAKLRWLLPAVLGLAFLAFSLITVSQEGLAQFWLNHTANLTGNQVWFDLLFAVTISFYLIAPRARSVGMPLLPWGVAVIATACLALLPMLARLLWLEQQNQ